jgi:hypothetical protein
MNFSTEPGSVEAARSAFTRLGAVPLIAALDRAASRSAVEV